MVDQPSSSAADRLRELKGLHTEGLISDEEFAEMRASLLRELGAPGDSQPPHNSPEAAVPVEMAEAVDASQVPLGEVGPDDMGRPRKGVSKRDLLLGFGILAVVGFVVAVVVVTVYYQGSDSEWPVRFRAASDSGAEWFNERSSQPELGSGTNCDLYEEWQKTSLLQGAPLERVQRHWEIADFMFTVAETYRVERGVDWGPEEDAIFVAGFWLEASRNCPSAFANPTIRGRP